MNIEQKSSCRSELHFHSSSCIFLHAVILFNRGRILLNPSISQIISKCTCSLNSMSTANVAAHSRPVIYRHTPQFAHCATVRSTASFTSHLPTRDRCVLQGGQGRPFCAKEMAACMRILKQLCSKDGMAGFLRDRRDFLEKHIYKFLV
jgi:hypothetical protein